MQKSTRYNRIFYRLIALTAGVMATIAASAFTETRSAHAFAQHESASKDSAKLDTLLAAAPPDNGRGNGGGGNGGGGNNGGGGGDSTGKCKKPGRNSVKAIEDMSIVYLRIQATPNTPTTVPTESGETTEIEKFSVLDRLPDARHIVEGFSGPGELVYRSKCNDLWQETILYTRCSSF